MVWKGVPMKKLLFIVNPRAGKTKSRAPLFDAAAEFSRAGYLVNIFVTEAGGQARDMAARCGGDYDLIVTGDLGALGREIVLDLFAREGIDLSKNYTDCGLLLYDLEQQDMHAGGSGCGCSAAVLNGYLLRMMREGCWRRIIFAPTGALLSPTSSFQGESIPGICHAVVFSAAKEGF